MVLKGWRVEVFADPLSSDLGLDSHGVLWRRHTALDLRGPNAPDVFVAWRYHISAALPLALQGGGGDGLWAPQKQPKVFVWLQDVPSFATYTPGFTSRLAGIFTLSGFHARMLPPHARPLAKVTPNGLDAAFFRDGPNAPRNFVYGSAPNRGLETVLRLWPSIRERLPGAELDVFYGFTESFLRYGREHLGPGFPAWLAEMRALVAQPGVNLRGMVDHAALAEGYANAGFILYPTRFPETGCVTLMKAMAMGAVPVTSRFADSTLPELTGDFDLGPSRPLPENVDSEIGDASFGWAAEWLEAVVAASRRDERGGLAEHRRAMKADARRRFLWSHVAELWHESFLA